MSLENSSDFLLNLSVHDVNGEDKHFYRFKSFRLDVAERRLLNDGVPVPLMPKVFDVLAFLVERNGHLVEKNELLSTVWADSFVEESNIARIIYELRKVLGEGENGNKYIETVAKKGYRFVAEVTEMSAPTAVAGGFPDDGQSAARAGSRNGAFEELPSAERRLPVGGKAKPNTRIILFAVGFLSAIFLIVLLSFSFRPGNSVNPNKPKSIAVLPVKPLATNNRDELYEVGIADSLINKLGLMKGVVVRPLAATRQFADINQDPLAAGRELKADYVLASNYQIADGRIRVTAQLIDVSSGQIEETYKSEKDAGSVFAMQDAVANEVGNKLLALFGTTAKSQAAKRGTTNEEAYRLYLQGINLTNKRSQADAQKAVEYFEQAVRLDPNYALGYVGMANAYSAMGTLRGGRPREAFEKAWAAVNKAVELDPDLADIYVARGTLKHLYEWDFAGAEKDLKTAVELEPNNDLAHCQYALWLNHQGRFDEALAEIETALEIDPNSLVYSRERGRFCYFARRYDEAIAHLERVLEIDPNFGTAFHWLILAYEKKGDYAGAFRWHLTEQKQLNPESVEMFQKAYETGGWKEFRRKLLEFEKLHEPIASNYYRIAREHALLGEKEPAFDYLNKAFEKQQTNMAMLKVEPAFDSLRADPRFDELLSRMGFN